MSGAAHPLQSQPVKTQPPTLGQPTGNMRQEPYQSAPLNTSQNQMQPPSSQDSEWPRGPVPIMSSQRPVSSNQQHERSFSSASMLNTSGPTASQPPYSNRNSMGPGGLLQLQQASANSRYNGGMGGSTLTSQGPPQLGALSFQDPAQPPQGPQFAMDSAAREPPHHPSQGSTAPVQEPSRPVFGVSLGRLYERDGLAVPMVVYQCIQAVDLYGLNVEGIYRLSGSQAHVNKLKSMFDTGELFAALLYLCDVWLANIDAIDTTSPQLDFRNPENFFHDVNSVAGLLKQFFRDLPDPLLTREYYDNFIEAASTYNHVCPHCTTHVF